MVDQFGGDGLGQRFLDLTLIGPGAEAQLAEALDDPVGRGRTQIALQQMLFQLVESGLAERLLDEGGDDLLGHLLRGAGSGLR
jgi:hypothetical protein